MAENRGSGTTLIKGGTVLTIDPHLGDIEGGDVLIEDGIITAVGSDIDAPTAEVVDARNHYVLPGFVDTHRHTWQSVLRHVGSDWSLGQYLTGIHFGMSGLFRPEDTYIGNLLGITEALDSGITTTLDWSHNLATPEHADAAIEGLRDSGARAVFAHGGGAPQWQIVSDVDHPRDVLRIRDQYFASDDQLLTLAFAARGPQLATREVSRRDWALAREVGTRITVHVGDGEWGKSGPVTWLHAEGFTGPEMTYVHCNTITDDEIAIIAATGGTASVAADIETQMGHGWPATGRLLRAGIRPSLSIDVCTSNGGDMFHAMKTTISTQRALDNAALEEAGTAPERLELRCRDVVEFATLQGAIANGLDDKIGTLTPGKQADIIMIRATDLSMLPRNNPYGAIVYSAHAGMVDDVLVRGEFVKRHGSLVSVDVPRIKRLADASHEYLFNAARNKDVIKDAVPGGTWMPSALRA